MADPFDAAWDAAPGADPFDVAWESTPGSAPTSDLAAIRNSVVKGVGAPLGLIDLVVGKPLQWIGLDTPSFQDDYTKLVTDAGLLDNTKAATNYGKFAENVAENAAAAAPFGPLAMLVNGVAGGTGGFVGEKVAGMAGLDPSIGRTAGSVMAGFAPGAISKLGIVKEASESLGPTISQMLPRVLGGDAVAKAATDAAVGRALTKVTDDLPAAKNAISEFTQQMGPLTRRDALKTVDEITGQAGLARATDAVDNLTAGGGFKALADERAAANLADTMAIQKGSNLPLNKYDLSKNIEKAISSSVDDFEKTVESPAWAALDKGQEIVADVNTGLTGKLAEITFDGATPLEGPAKGLISLVQKAKDANGGVLTIEQVQALRSRALAVGRAAKGDFSAEGRMARDTASAVEEHLRDLVDANSEAGVLTKDVADAWKEARAATNMKFEKLSAQRSGTKALEKLGIQGDELDNAAILTEGLRNPAKLTAHLDAAESLGGPEAASTVRASYRVALLKQLEDKKQSLWGDIIGENRQVWERVFTPKELERIRNNADDAEAMARLGAVRMNAGTQGGNNSATNTRGNIQRELLKEKGIAGSAAANAASTIGALAGAQQGWSSADTTSGGIGRALLGGLLGATVGKGFRGAATRASEAFDSVLNQALKDPGTFARVIEAAEPSKFGTALRTGAIGASQAAAARGASSVLGNLAKRVIAPAPQSSTVPQPLGTTKEAQEAQATPMPTPPAKLKEVEAKIDADPFDSTVYEFESGRNPDAKNPQSTASGAFQLLKSTAKALGVTDPFDIEQNYAGFQRLKAENMARFGDDPKLLYAAHYLGAPLLAKVLEGKSITAEQQKQVQYLRETLLPRFMALYQAKQQVIA